MKKFTKLAVFFFAILAVFLTYKVFSKETNKLSYIALGDSVAAGRDSYGVEGYGYTDYIKDYLDDKGRLSFYTKAFTKSGYTTDDIIEEIEGNYTTKVDNKTIYLKEALRESDLVTLQIGANNFIHGVSLTNLEEKLNNIPELKKDADEIILEVEKVIVLVKKYAKEQIIVIGYYNPLPRFTTYKKEIDEVVKYFNNELEELCEEYNVDYVDIFDIFDNNEELLPNPFDIHPNVKGYETIANKLIKYIE